jgi:hypothetical protein
MFMAIQNLAKYGENTVTGYAVHALWKSAIAAGSWKLGTAKPVTVFL